MVNAGLTMHSAMSGSLSGLQSFSERVNERVPVASRVMTSCDNLGETFGGCMRSNVDLVLKLDERNGDLSSL